MQSIFLNPSQHIEAYYMAYIYEFKKCSALCRVDFQRMQSIYGMTFRFQKVLHIMQSIFLNPSQHIEAYNMAYIYEFKKCSALCRADFQRMQSIYGMTFRFQKVLCIMQSKFLNTSLRRIFVLALQVVNLEPFLRE